MADLKYAPKPHDHEAFLKEARTKKGFTEEYERLSEEFSLARELLRARAKAGMTQDQVAQSMGTTKSAISRLEAAGKHSPSVETLRRYAHAVGCEVQIRLVDSKSGQTSSRKGTGRRVKTTG